MTDASTQTHILTTPVTLTYTYLRYLVGKELSGPDPISMAENMPLQWTVGRGYDALDRSDALRGGQPDAA